MSDPRAAQAFFRAIFPALLDGECIEIRPIEDNVVKHRNWFATGDQAGKYAASLNGRHNVFFGVNPRRGRGGTKADVTRVLHLHADVDIKHFADGRAGALAAVAAFPLPPSLVIDSGGGLQVLYRLVEPITIAGADDPAIARIEGVLRRLYGALGNVDAVQDVSRVLRVPGTLNHKYDPPRLAQLIEHHPDRRYTLEQFEAFLPVPVEAGRPARTYLPAGTHTGDLPTLDDLRELLRFIPPHGDYQDHWLKILAAVHSAYPGPDGVAVCEEWSPGKPGEIEKKFASFKRTGSDAATVATLYYLASQGGWRRPQATLLVSPRPQHPVRPPVLEDATKGHAPEDGARPLSWQEERATLLAYCVELEATVRERDQRLERLERENLQLRDQHGQVWATLRNPHLKAEKVTALAVVNELASAQSRGKTDDDGYVRVTLDTVAQHAGISPKRASAHIAELARCGVIQKEVRPGKLKRVDPSRPSVRVAVTKCKVGQPIPPLDQRMTTVRVE